ncbi:enoyl-CoA hydratase [Lichenifustis flavocetrariae]|uniref:Enoyl-CoA hydratase domain-containing protein 3, mitochondrial n=1 Tax=Lichenifustis flavocetrariae TaxID=2949735 RepID=A0AA42CNV5_9HYPH|nr:enoyl-CoA hydratase [Lichenifustis flavocetrariae]MCW6509770.1 enoyl-CoA hydratase [Lichenifustis flavocetrariae]
MISDPVSNVSEEILLRSDQDGVATLRLNRPSRFNALSEAMLGALQRELVELKDDQTIRCVVLGGSGPAFCAGHDLVEMNGHAEEDYFQRLFAQCSEVMQAIRALPVPVIAEVHGIATAAGCQLVATCDMAVAGRAARFAVSGVNLGLFCSTPAVALSRNIPPKAAFDMLTTGRFIDADEALALGLVNAVVDDAALSASVAAKAAVICSKSPEAIRLGKQMFYAQAALPLADAYRYAADVMACNMMSTDARQGIEAFLTKRKVLGAV